MTNLEPSSGETVLEPEDGRAKPDTFPTGGMLSLALLTVLARRRRFIAAATGIGLLVGISTSLLLPVKYTASTSIVTPREAPSLVSLLVNPSLGFSSGAGSLMGSAGGLLLRNPNELYIGLLQSRPVLDEIIHQFGLMNLYHARDMTIARKKLLANTEIVSEKSELISISVKDRDKQRAADMANAYTSQLRVLTQSLAITEAAQRRLFYEDQLKRAKDSLVQAEFAFQQLQQAKGLVQENTQAAAMINGLAHLRAEATEKEIEIQALRSYSTDRNPEVQMAETQLASLRQEISNMEERSHSQRPFDLGLEDIPKAGIEYLQAEHEVQYRQTLFDLLLKLYDSARLDEAREAVVIQVVEPAVTPDRKSSPQRAPISLLAAALGFVIGCAGAFAGRLKASLNADPVIAGQMQDLKKAFTNRG
jgi:uncharacterized protein involved in exopolysaccharide biosynthesis